MRNQSAKVGPRSAVRRGVRGRETKTGGRRQKTTKKRPGPGGGREEKRDPPVVEVAPATSWRGRTRPTIPEETRGEGATNNGSGLALSGVSPRNHDRSILRFSSNRGAGPAKPMSARSTLNFI